MVPGVALLGSRLFLEAGGDVPHVLSSSCSVVPKPVLLIPCPSFHPNALLNPCGGWAPVLWVSVRPWQGAWGLAVRGLCQAMPTAHGHCAHRWPEGQLGAVPLCQLQHRDVGTWGCGNNGRAAVLVPGQGGGLAAGGPRSSSCWHCGLEVLGCTAASEGAEAGLDPSQGWGRRCRGGGEGWVPSPGAALLCRTRPNALSLLLLSPSLSLFLSRR